MGRIIVTMEELTRRRNEKEKIQEEIFESIQQTKYGEVIITIHDSEIVQVERREKKRFNLSKLLHKQS